MTPEPLRFLASAPRGLSDLLARELSACGAHEVRERSLGVAFCGDLESGYRACLWSRIASRVLLELARFEAHDAQQLYPPLRASTGSHTLIPARTLACEFSGRHPAITHTHFGALKVKDGIVDAMRDRHRRAP